MPSDPPPRDTAPTIPDLVEAAVGRSDSDAPAVRWWYRRWRTAAPHVIRHAVTASVTWLAAWISHALGWWHDR